MCREKGAVRHDDRLDCLAQGVKYYTDAMGISAYEQVKQRKKEDWQDMLEAFVDNPEQATQHLALGFDLEMRRKARQEDGNKGVYNWV